MTTETEYLHHLDVAMNAADYRSALLSAAKVHEWLNRELPLIVRGARQDGASWQEVGDALGITRQAAQQRFHD